MSESRYSNVGNEIDDFGELSVDYAPPPIAQYGSADGSGANEFATEVQGRRAKRKKAVILGTVAGIFGIVLLGLGSFFWFQGLQNLTASKTDPLQHDFESGQANYNANNWPESIKIMEQVSKDDLQFRFQAVNLYIFAGYMQQAERDMTTKSPQKALANYKKALDVQNLNGIKLVQVAASVDSSKQPPLPNGISSFAEWVNLATSNQDKLQLYITTLEADTNLNVAPTNNKLGEANKVVASWEDLFKRDPLFLIDDVENGVAPRLITNYLTRANLTCDVTKKGMSDVEKANSVANDPRVGSKLSSRFKAQIKSVEDDLQYRKCS